MIKNVAQILQAFMEEESKKLNKYKLKHGPTIGDMYEGLSAEIINRAVPEKLGLQVLNGFVHDGLGNLSGQIDCMLVKGEGEKIPHTNSYKWHVKDVLAAFEVKKNLYSKELIDSFCHLRDVVNSFSDWMFKSKDDEVFEINSSLRVFSKITGIHAPDYKNSESLPPDLQLIYHTLITEQLSPIRIVLGYGGYKSEKSLRDGLIAFLKKPELGIGYGVPSFPHIITCNGISLVKLNGQPFFQPMTSDDWDFYASTTLNPLHLILELIWTKISNTIEKSIYWDDDLEVIVMNRFLSAKPINESNLGGWMFNYTDLDRKSLNENPKVDDWKPLEVSINEYTVFNILCREGSLNINSSLFEDIVNESKMDKKEFILGLTSTSFIAIDGQNLKLTTDNCVCAILPTGQFVVAENKDGQLFKYMKKIKKKV